MTPAGGFDQSELCSAESEPAKLERTCERRASRAMLRIVVVSDPSRIVEHGEEANDDRIALSRPLREVESDRCDVPPVILAVKDRVERRRSRPDEREDPFEVE